jgi:hypothetical protein
MKSAYAPGNKNMTKTYLKRFLHDLFLYIVGLVGIFLVLLAIFFCIEAFGKFFFEPTDSSSKTFMPIIGYYSLITVAYIGYAKLALEKSFRAHKDIKYTTCFTFIIWLLHALLYIGMKPYIFWLACLTFSLLTAYFWAFYTFKKT